MHHPQPTHERSLIPPVGRVPSHGADHLPMNHHLRPGVGRVPSHGVVDSPASPCAKTLTGSLVSEG